MRTPAKRRWSLVRTDSQEKFMKRVEITVSIERRRRDNATQRGGPARESRVEEGPEGDPNALPSEHTNDLRRAPDARSAADRCSNAAPCPRGVEWVFVSGARIT